MPLSTFAFKLLASKVFGEQAKIGKTLEDPYFEEVEFEKRSFWSGSTKLVKCRREKSIPEYVAEKDRKLLRRLRKRAYRMEMMFNFCGIRFGWLGIIGLVPVIGDLITVMLSLMVYKEAKKVEGGLTPDIEFKFLTNIAIDFVLGLVPIVGDIVGICYKANSRNVLVLENHLDKKYRHLAVTNAVKD